MSRVGSDEVFEPVQSFYSGAAYQPDREDQRAEPVISRVALNGSKTVFRRPRLRKKPRGAGRSTR